MVSRDQVAHVQSLADILILALSKGNGNLCLPSKMTSYLLSGKPVLASVDVDSTTAKYIHEAGCGYVVPPDDVQALKDGFLHLASLEQSQLEQQGRQGKVFALSNLTRQVNLDIIISRINQILE